MSEAQILSALRYINSLDDGTITRREQLDAYIEKHIRPWIRLHNLVTHWGVQRRQGELR